MERGDSSSAKMLEFSKERSRKLRGPMGEMSSSRPSLSAVLRSMATSSEMWLRLALLLRSSHSF
jgi:hypothetical protein